MLISRIHRILIVLSLTFPLSGTVWFKGYIQYDSFWVVWYFNALSKIRGGNVCVPTKIWSEWNGFRRTFCDDIWKLKILCFLFVWLVGFLQWKVCCYTWLFPEFQQFPFGNIMHLIIGKGIMVSIKAEYLKVTLIKPMHGSVIVWWPQQSLSVFSFVCDCFFPPSNTGAV